MDNRTHRAITSYERILAQYKPIFTFAQHAEKNVVPTSGLLLLSVSIY